MFFSLVMPTLNRPAEVARFLASLDTQTHRDFELIVVDQNAVDRLSAILAPYTAKFPIKHIRTGKKIGASVARNLGAASMTGDVLCFPDDDCWYDPDCLERVARLLESNPGIDGLTGCVVGQRYFSKRSRAVNKYRVWWQCMEFSIFFRSRIVDRIGLMDPTMGPGAGTPWGACEGVDYILRAVDAGFNIQYFADLQIHHPGAIDDPRSDWAEARCIYKYSVGKGRVLYDHDYPLWFVAYMMLRPLVGGTVSLLKLRPTKAWISLMVPIGVARGYLIRLFSSADGPQETEAAPLS